MLEIFGILVLSALGLYIGAELLISGGSSLALRFGFPSFVIGLVVVGYGSGFPELIVSINASLAERGDIAIGNIVGSNISNIGLVLGFVLLCHPVTIEKVPLTSNGIILILVSALFSLVILSGTISSFAGGILLLSLLAYTFWTVVSAKKEEKVSAKQLRRVMPHVPRNLFIDIAYLVLGLVLLLYGGHSFLTGAVSLAQHFDVSDAVIGLTIVAIGTSLPELATSIVAVFRKQKELALGNILGSCIFNILGIVGLAAFMHPITILGINWIDCAMMTGTALALCILITRPVCRLTRVHGALFLLTYVGYIFYLTSAARISG